MAKYQSKYDKKYSPSLSIWKEEELQPIKNKLTNLETVTDLSIINGWIERNMTRQADLKFLAIQLVYYPYFSKTIFYPIAQFKCNPK